jgi:choline dehydrogenase-like flavoprotein
MSFVRETIVGNRALIRFDAIVIGSGAGGAATAEILARHGQKVLILEAGPNWHLGLDAPDPAAIRNAFSNDELKFARRNFLTPDPLVDPRSFRESEADGERREVGDVNHLPRCVGGAGVHANLATPRFDVQSFELGRRLGARVPGASFADWPMSYAELEPFYLYNEWLLGVQGEPEKNPFEPPRSGPLPMPAGPDHAAGYRIGEAAAKLGYHPYLTPHAINSRFYAGRPPCAGCGFCGGYGCPIDAKGSPAVTSLRRALRSGNALLLSETRAVKILLGPGGREVVGVEALDPSGSRVTYRADRYVLGCGAIEDARLCLLSGDGSSSGPGAAIGNASGLVGRNLSFHLIHSVAGVFRERLHGHRGKTHSVGFQDLRGEAESRENPLGGIVITGTSTTPVQEALQLAGTLRMAGSRLWRALRESAFRERIFGMSMYAEDAPQESNRVDLDPALVDMDGIPAARITYRSHAFELEVRKRVVPKMLEILSAAGAFATFRGPMQIPSETRHIFGTLRAGGDPKTSVCRRDGRFHDIGNLHATGSSLFPTSSGFNPYLTIASVGSWVGACMFDANNPERAIAADLSAIRSGAARDMPGDVKG